MSVFEALAGHIKDAFPRRRADRASSVFADTSMAQVAWERRRRAAMRFGIAGAVLGAFGGVIAFAPAAWLAAAVASATEGRLLLAEARGTVWRGSALVVLTGGAGSRDAAALPSRLEWSIGLNGLAAEINLRQACCLSGSVPLLVRPGFGRFSVVVPAMPDGLGQWPAAWLSGLGTPFNTLQPGGALRVASPGATVEFVQGRLRFVGSLSVDAVDISSRLTTLDVLGSYRVVINGGEGGETTALQLSTLTGALQLSGRGQWAGAKMRFTGEASVAEGAEAALNNLLNIIGRRQGARSIISIG